MNHSKPIALPARLSDVTCFGSKKLPSTLDVPAPPIKELAPKPTATEIEAHLKEKQQIEVILTRLDEAAEKLKAQHEFPLHEMQRLAVELGMAVAARITHARMASGEFSVENMVRDLIGQLQPKEPITIYLHPEDLHLLEKRLGQRLSNLITEVPVEYRADADLNRGDCKAQTGDMCIWSEMQRQFWDIRDLLLEGLPFDPRGPS